MDCVHAVEMRHITKRFGEVTANDNVDLSLNRGEILALLGENGSGKTTLMNMLSGIYRPDGGEIFVNGQPAAIRSPRDAFAYGIGMVHQHFKLVDVFTAAENMALGQREPGGLDLKAVCARIQAISQRYGFQIDPNKKVYDMSVSEKQTVEIVKVLYRGADVLILDEPTAVLTPQETQKLFRVLRSMKQDGKAVVIITHKLNEVMEISDRVAVLRRGRFVGSVPTAETGPQALTNMMVGHAVALNINRPDPVDPRPRLTLRGVTVMDGEGIARLKDVSFEARSGEILGVAGIAGSGQKELLESIAGLCPVSSGSILYAPEGQQPYDLVGKRPRSIQQAGISLAFVPEDRLGMGLVGDMGMVGNMMLRSWRKGRGAFVQWRDPSELARQVKEQLDVATPSVVFPVRRLSGGNVQKVLVGREIASHPTVMMSAYAVRGLDINTSYTIYNLMTEQKLQGCAVIFVGEDLDVLLELCDRILVLCGGRVSGIVDARSATKEQLGLLMTGTEKEATA
ncbi:MAG: ABC transporter ATP-binding protein [Oscillospiraceae bacterium]|nr:ABC transporter ATP-binding protein [Oscillospiraceae bacterium]